MRDIEELMQLAVDGTATPAEQAELEKLLASSPSARSDFDALHSLVRQLDTMPSVDPPPMQRVWGPASAGRARSRRPWFALAYAAAALIVIAVAIYRAAPPADRSAATMMHIEEEWRVVARSSSGGVTLTIRRNGDELAAIVRPPDIPYSFEWDAEKLDRVQPNRFRRRPGAAGSTVIRLVLPEKPALNATVDLR